MFKLREREHELAAVEMVLEHGGVLVVEGGAGIGKTSLVEVACRRAAARNHEILRARGSELEADFAFGVVRQLFERRLAAAAAAEREALLAGPACRGGLAALRAARRSVGLRHFVRRLARCTGWPPTSRPAGRCTSPSCCERAR